MRIEDCFKEMESFQFQLQFAGASGLLALYESMRRHPTVARLVTVSNESPEIARRIYQRFIQLLSQFSPDKQLFDDETFFAYMVCLVESDIRLALQACGHVPRSQGLMWTRWLVVRLRSVFDVVYQTLDMSNEAGESRASSKNTLVTSVEVHSRSRVSQRTVVDGEHRSIYPVQMSMAS